MKPPIATEPPHLLDDATVQRYIVDGHLAIRPTLPADYHPALKAQLDALIERDGNPGNDLIERVPDLARLFADPAVAGALQSLLGPGYILHRHCHCHDWAPGSEGQAWHKDYPIGGHPRCHRSRWALLFYYPQDVSDDMGPTAVQSSSQYYMDPRSGMPEVALAVETGTVVIAHYDIWHRATANTGDRTRYMLKFLFARRRDPTVPAWDARTAAWTPPPGDHRTLWQHMWHWHRGEAKPAPAPEDPGIIATHIAALDDPDPLARRHAADDLGTIRAPTAVPALAARLRDEDEAVRLNAAYALGGQEAVDALIDALRCEAAERWQGNLDHGDFTDPGQFDAPYGLAAAAAAAVPALQQALSDADGPLRAAAATALGYIGPAAAPAAGALVQALADDDEWVRRHAAEALGCIGPTGEAARGLIAALEDRRPVTRWSLSTDPFRESVASALARMESPTAAASTALRAALADGEYVRAWAASGLQTA